MQNICGKKLKPKDKKIQNFCYIAEKKCVDVPTNGFLLNQVGFET